MNILLNIQLVVHNYLSPSILNCFISSESYHWNWMNKQKFQAPLPNLSIDFQERRSITSRRASERASEPSLLWSCLNEGCWARPKLHLICFAVDFDFANLSKGFHSNKGNAHSLPTRSCKHVAGKKIKVRERKATMPFLLQDVSEEVLVSLLINRVCFSHRSPMEKLGQNLLTSLMSAFASVHGHSEKIRLSKKSPLCPRRQRDGWCPRFAVRLAHWQKVTSDRTVKSRVIPFS